MNLNPWPTPSPNPIPDSITNLTLEATNLEPSTFGHGPRLGHIIELNRGLQDQLPPLIPALTSAVLDHDPTAFNAFASTELAPSLVPHAIAHLEELDASTPSHKWAPHWRIRDLIEAFGRRRHG